MHMAELCRSLCEWRKGALGSRTSTGCGATPDDREYDTPAVAYGLRQHQVVFRVVEVFLAQQDVHADSAWRLRRNPVNQLGMQCAAPWPAPNCLKAGRIDGYDDDVWAGVAWIEPGNRILNQMVDTRHVLWAAEPQDESE